METAIRPLQVSEVNAYIKELLDRDENLRMICIEGEISNYVNHTSGHSYFTLKDKSAALKAVFFKGYKMGLRFLPKNGMRVLAVGDISIYPRDGVYQLYVQHLYPAGIGEIYADFERLKEKLAKEGLFDTTHKKPIPKFCEHIGVISSPTGAAIQDIRSVVSRRYPAAQIDLYPVKVQGTSSAKEVIAGLEYLNRRKPDVIIIARGGGALEDLYSFNDEALARAIYASKVPVITAIGHEIDFTIADFVADLRAPTPSAAAELAVPDRMELLAALGSLESLLMTRVRQQVNSYQEAVQDLALAMHATVQEAVERRREKVLALEDKILQKSEAQCRRKRAKMQNYAVALEYLSPVKVLARGYGILQKRGKVISSVKEVHPGEMLEIRLRDGEMTAQVESVRKGEEQR